MKNGNSQQFYKRAFRFIFCQHCSREFESKNRDRKFCSISCYRSSDYYREVRKKLVEKVSKPKELNTCLNCGKERYLPPHQAKKQKYCNKICGREYMANRFDRYIANPEALALPQNYDEFLTKDELPCLIADCKWRGQNLANHVNRTHGIPRDRLKELGGFNKSSGLVSKKLAKKFSRHARTAQRIAYARHNVEKMLEVHKASNFSSVKKKRTVRLEGKEHAAKAWIERSFEKEELDGKCPACGKAFTTTMTWQKYCSIKCQQAFLRRPDREHYAQPHTEN